MAVTTRSARQLGSIFQNRLENLGSDLGGDHFAAIRASFQAASGTGGTLAAAAGAPQITALFDANQRGLGGNHAFSLSGIGSADFSKLQMGLAQMYLEAQTAAGTATGAARDALLADFHSANVMANVVNGMVAIDAVAKNGDGAALLAELQALGLQHGASFGGMAGGYIAIDMLDEMSNLGLLAFARPVYAVTMAGAVTSQDAPAMHTDFLNTAGFDGTGITIGVLSDSFNTRTTALTHYADDVTSGDLPAGVAILADSPAPGTDEGRGMAQVAYDIAPGAQFAFHTANVSMADFAQGILDLRAAGAQIIVDDVRYFLEPMFQDGILAQAVDQVVADGAMYFSSAGNYAQQSYESAWRSSGQTLTNSGFTYELFDFDPGAGVDATQTILLNGSASNPVRFILQWDQPFASVSGTGSTNDLAFFLRDHTTGAVLLAADADNIGFDPVEFLGVNSGGGTVQVDISIGKFSGGDPGLIKYVEIGGGFAMSEWNTASGTSYGHSNAAGAISVGAADWFNTPAFGQTPPLGEYFTSRGDVPILFDTAGNRLDAPEYRSNVDFTAADGGNTTFFSSDVAGDADTFPNFYGTSAAAPNAAAIAALLMQAFPGATRAQIEQALKATAIDITSLANNINSHTLGVATGAGYDHDTGWGLIQANAAFQYLADLLNPNAVLSTGQAQIISVSTEDTIPGGAVAADGISFILLAPLAAGAKLYITDRNWNGSAFTSGAGEGTYTYTAGADMPAGTVVHLSQADLTAAGMALSSAGETIYLYQGITADAPSVFLHAVDIADGTPGFDGTELTNTGLVNGSTAVAIADDNAEFGGRTHNIQIPDLLASINTASHWVHNDNSPQDGTATGTPAFTAPDSQIWVAASGAGEGIVTINLDSTFNSGTLGYQIVQAFQNDANLFHPSDITLDTVHNKAFFVDSDISGGHNRIVQVNISDLLNNPGSAMPFTVLYSDTGTGSASSIRTLSVDTAHGIIYFDHGTTFNKVVYNTANQTPTVLANLNSFGTNNFITQVSIDYATHQVLLGSSRVTSFGAFDQVSKNYLYSATGWDENSSTMTFTRLNFNPDDNDSGGINNPNIPGLAGEAFPAELGTIRGIDIDTVNHVAYIVTGSVIMDVSAAQDGSQLQTFRGGIYSYALTGNPNGDFTQLYLQDGVNGPKGLMYYIEVDPATGKYYVIDETGTNADPGDGAVYVGTLGAVGTPTFLATVGNFNGLGPQGLEIQHAPTLAGTDLAATYTETAGNPSPNGTEVQIANAFDAHDADSEGDVNLDELAGAQIRISDNFQSGAGHQDVLTIVGITSGALVIGADTVNYSYNSATGVMTVTGIASLDTYEAVLGLVRLRVDGDNPTNYGTAGTRTLSFSTFDGLLYSDEVNATVTVTGINDAPVNAVGGTHNGTEDATTFITGVSVSDVDADPASQKIVVTLHVGHGTLDIFTNVGGGVTVADVANNGTDTVTITATQNQINATFAAANGIGYTPNANFNGNDTLTVTTNDQGFNGTGGALQDQDDKSIVVAAVNDAPVVAGDGSEDSVGIFEDQPSAVGQTVSSLFGGQFSDPVDDQTGFAGGSSPNGLAGIAVIDNDATAGTGNWEYFNGATWVTIPTSASLASATLIAAGTAIRFNPAQDYSGPEPLLTVRLVDDSGGALTDGTVVNLSSGIATGGTTRYSAGSVTLGGTVTAVNDAPTSTGLSGDSVTWTEGDGAVFLDSGGNAAIADIDSADFNGGSLTVHIGAGGVPGEDLLGIDTSGTVSVAGGVVSVGGNAIGTVSGGGAADLVVSFTSANATPAAVQALVRAITYTNAGGDNPTDGDRTISWTLVDGDGNANGGADTLVVTTTLDVDPVNDDPVIANLGGDSATYTEEGPAVFLDSGVAATVSDVDNADFNGGTLLVSIAANLVPTEDVLAIDTSGTVSLSAGMTVGSIVSVGGLAIGTISADGTGGTDLFIDLDTADATAARISTLVQALTYANTNTLDPSTLARTISVTLVDPAGGMDIESVTVNVIDEPENTAPVVDLDSGTAGLDYAVAYTEGDAAIPIGSGISVTDADAGVGDLIVSARVTLTDAVAGDDLFIQGALPAGFNAVITNNAGSIVIDITGPGTGADYDGILGQIRYVTTSDDPTVGGTDMARTITVTVNDGTIDSAVATTTVNLTAVDDAPVAQPDLFTIMENGSISGGDLFANHGSGADQDPDGPAISIAQVNGSAANVGTQITLASGALLTVNADGTFDYDPNGRFLTTPAPGSGASNTPGHDSFTYMLAGGNTVTVDIQLTGIDSNDLLRGTAGADILIGGNGNDLYFVENAGDQTIELIGGGTDRVLASVSYTLSAGEVEQLTTTDHMGTAAINLFGNGFDNLIIGNEGNNVLDGDGGQDVISGRGGNDIIYGGAGRDYLYGNAGNDFYFVDSDDFVNELAGEGNDRVFAISSFSLLAGAEIEVLSTADDAGTAAINLTGNELANAIFGNAGANILDGRGGADLLAGRGGDDFYYVDNALDRVGEVAGEGNDRVFASVSYTLGAGTSVETLSTDSNAGTAAINLTGNELAQTIIGNAGANVITGGGGADVLVGFGGDDVYFVSTASTTIVEAAGQGNDRVFASVSYTLSAGASVELLTTSFHAGTDAINLTGNELANVIQGNDGANVLDGKGGNDILIGLGGADTFAFTTALGPNNIDFISGFEHGVDKIALDDAIFTAIGGLGALNPNAFVIGFHAADASDRIIYDDTSGRLYYDADGLGGAAQVQIAILNGSLPLTASDFVVI